MTDDITAEPSSDYETLRKQFISLRTLANSKSRQVSHWRKQTDRESREDLLTNAANVNAERDTNKILSDALIAAEDERDQLKADNERLKRNRDMWRDQVEEQSKELTSFRKNSLMMAEAFKKDIDAFRKDAMRYQYLRRDLSRGGDSDFCIVRKYLKSPSLERILSLESADEEIDTAMDDGK
jgi:small-conductance mechanosensitive channel